MYVDNYLCEVRERAEQVDKNTNKVMLAVAVEKLFVFRLSLTKR